MLSAFCCLKRWKDIWEFKRHANEKLVNVCEFRKIDFLVFTMTNEIVICFSRSVTAPSYKKTHPTCCSISKTAWTNERFFLTSVAKHQILQVTTRNMKTTWKNFASYSKTLKNILHRNKTNLKTIFLLKLLWDELLRKCKLSKML